MLTCRLCLQSLGYTLLSLCICLRLSKCVCPFLRGWSGVLWFSTACWTVSSHYQHPPRIWGMLGRQRQWRHVGACKRPNLTVASSRPSCSASRPAELATFSHQARSPSLTSLPLHLRSLSSDPIVTLTSTNPNPNLTLISNLQRHGHRGVAMRLLVGERLPHDAPYDGIVPVDAARANGYADMSVLFQRLPVEVVTAARAPTQLREYVGREIKSTDVQQSALQKGSLVPRLTI